MNNDSVKLYETAKNMISDALDGNELHMILSPYTTNSIGDLHNVPVQGEFVINKHYDEFWAQNVNGADYISEVLNSPTWLELCVIANQMMEVTKDFHHVFLESINDTGNTDANGVKIYTFFMGS